ncbi:MULTISPECIES: DUF445 domain-containing protein [Alteromonadaceae]|uniref:DUF445 domain-containing protein n=1 Tax=Alteromonadaceae TaxID=72275 RepID=UPI001C09A5CE|nr:MULTISPECIES: DUF445 family protein [Aliiglaciecola]MBU2880082.1 DUF445 family protein [Aliiglaciecola lipolytica]MDO6710920.1 DUF445 family protein [Aliiglaciecola sp. 2_MG-2023]MDO6752401.1 DUF445 family protein [Aliiglaciecola sp. 1_MG-2023]
MQWILENYLLLLIPITSGIVGWATNFLAVKMMFYPIEFIGIRPFFGWQGLIPMKRQEMAEIEVELVLGKLLSVQELAGRIEADKMTASIQRRLKQVLRKVINQVMQESAPQIWASMPVQAKNLVYKRVEADIPNMVTKMIDDFQHNVEEILDIKELVVSHLVNEPELINEIFLKSGEKEFPFIERSGLYFGFLFGLPTMAFWYWFQSWWILPLGGLIVGYATNWIAIKIIFEPKQPIRLFGITFQGMFLKRQKEVSEVYSEIIEKKLINSKNITEIVLHGSGSEQLLELIELHVNDAIERYVAIAQPYFALGVGSKQYYRMKALAVQLIFDSSDKYLQYAYEYANDALRVGDDLCARMQLLTPEEFEGVLRPAYQADEWKLIVVGAVLGMIAGFMQLYLI